MRLLVVLAVCLACTGCNGGTVDRHALTKDGEAVKSLSCEGRLLARGISTGRTTTTFARVHAGGLRQRASNFEDALSDRPTDPDIERAVRSLARKAGRVAALLEALERAPEDRAEARRLEPLLAKAGGCP